MSERKWVSKLDFNPIYTFLTNESVIGIYQGSRNVEKIDSLLHTIIIGDMEFDFYGCGGLDKQLSDIDTGQEIKIFYGGKRPANVEDKQGKMIKTEVHNYIVFTLDE